MGILEVHSRDKKLEPDVNFQKVARATAGFTGAELMNLMNTAAVQAVRQGRDSVSEADIFEVVHCLIASHLHKGLPLKQGEAYVLPT